MTGIAISHESRHAPQTALALHRHSLPYAALVLDGSYEEASMDGRFACGRGTLIVHPSWHAHGDTFGAGGATVLNLPLPDMETHALQAFCLTDVDRFEQLAHDNPALAAREALAEGALHAPLAPARWLLRYVRDLLDDDSASTGALARRIGISPEHASRACRSWFGVSPSALRREGQLRRAIRVLRAGGSPSDAVHEAGFCDQPHLTRLLKKMTGLTPARLRCA